MQERKSEAGGKLGHELAMRAQALARMHQAPRAGVHALGRIAQAPAHLAREAARAVGEKRGELQARRAGELRRRGRRRGTLIGGEVGDREVGLVPDADHHGDA
jgi:hypothetical protein